MTLKDEAPIVDGFLSARDKVLVVGREASGKSILLQQLALCVAGGHSYLGMNVPERRTVLYVAGEGDADELQKRAITMGRMFPDVEDNLWYWPIPSNPLNLAQGMRDLEQAIELIGTTGRTPQLTIIDPIYAVMTGSMRDDGPTGDFVRNMNKVQALTDGAVVLAQHVHREIRTRDGDVIDEGSDAVFGSMLWKAWAKTIYLLKHKRGDSSQRSLSCGKERRPVALTGRPLDLILVEPDPLYFAVADSGRTPTDEAVLSWLKDGPSTVQELVDLSAKSERGIRESLSKLVEQGLVAASSGPINSGRPRLVYRVS